MKEPSWHPLWDAEEAFGQCDELTASTMVARVAHLFPAPIQVYFVDAKRDGAAHVGHDMEAKGDGIYFGPNIRRLVVAHELAHLRHRSKQCEHCQGWGRAYSYLAGLLWPNSDISNVVRRLSVSLKPCEEGQGDYKTPFLRGRAYF